MPVKKKVVKKKVVKKPLKKKVAKKVAKKPVKRVVKRRAQPKPRRAQPKLPAERAEVHVFPPKQKENGKLVGEAQAVVQLPVEHVDVRIPVPAAPDQIPGIKSPSPFPTVIPKPSEELIEPTDLDAEGNANLQAGLDDVCEVVPEVEGDAGTDPDAEDDGLTDIDEDDEDISKLM